MAYTPTNWQIGDIITAEKLNNMEEGIENAVLFVHENYDESTGVYTLDKTWQEIADADFAILLYKDADDSSGHPYRKVCWIDEVAYFIDSTASYYGVKMLFAEAAPDGTVNWQGIIYKTDSPDGYPSATDTD